MAAVNASNASAGMVRLAAVAARFSNPPALFDGNSIMSFF